MVHAEYHPLDNPGKGVGLHYNLFSPLQALLPLEMIDLKKYKKSSMELNPRSRVRRVVEA
jgi:hypothetical protein